VTSLRPVGRRASDIVRLTGLAFWRGFLGFYDSDDLTYAASIAYYALLSLFPVLLLAFALLGWATADVANRLAVFSFVLRYFPTEFDFIAKQLDAFRTSTVTFGVAGTLGLLWGAGGFFGAITTAVNYAWGVEKPRSFWQQKLLALVMLGVAALILLIALLLVSATQVVTASWFAGIAEHFPGLLVLRSLTIRYATTILFIVVVGLIYYFVPNAEVRFPDVWIGAVVTGLLWKGALEGFSWYVRDMSQFTRVNGSVGVVVVFLLWVYTQAVILLYGVEFTAAYARLRRGRPEDVSAAPSPRARELDA
jgi:membrane protein